MSKDVGGRGSRNSVQVDLALQGGGSHGAYTWGVLDRLLEEPWIKIEAISGTSAGRDERRRAGQRIHAGRRGGRPRRRSTIIGRALRRPRGSARSSARRSTG